MVHLLVQMPDFQLRLEVDLVVVARAGAVLRLLPLLAHHDHRCLHRREAGQREIEQDERVGVEMRDADDVDRHPDREEQPERDQEAPAPAETSDMVGQPLAERPVAVDLVIGVAGDQLGRGQARRHLPVELTQLAPLARQQSGDVAGAVARDLILRHQRMRLERRVVAADRIRQRRAQRVEPDQLASGQGASRQGAERPVIADLMAAHEALRHSRGRRPI